MRFLIVLACLAVLVLGVLGCGGNGGGSPVVNESEGVYQTSFTRSIAHDTGITLIIQTDCDTYVAIADSTHILSSGIGKTTLSGDLSVTATGEGGTVQVTGSANNDGTISIHLSGATTQDLTVSRFETSTGNLFRSPWIGTYNGTLGPDQLGFAIDADRNVTGFVADIINPAGIPVTGTVSEFGHITFGGGGYEFEGDIFFGPEPGPHAAGSLTSPPNATGSWSAGLD